MKIYSALEMGEIDVPIDEIIKPGGQIDINSNAKKYFSIDYKPKNTKLSLVAGQYIGLIPINENLAIEIRPKFSISNLSRIVSIAKDNFNTLNFFSKKYRETGNSEFVVFEFMADSLLNELRDLFEEGLLKEYSKKTEQTGKIRGRVDVGLTMKHLWSRGHFHNVVASYFDYTLDNKFNRMIKFTLKFCIDELNFSGSKKIDLINSLIEFYSMFESVPLDKSCNFYEDVLEAIAEQKISELRHYYINICEICRLIMDGKGISFDSPGEHLRLSSFTLDMANTFEKYLLHSIRGSRDLLPSNYVVLDGNDKEGMKRFYNQPSLDEGVAKPDIIIKDASVVHIIADAKYKLKTKEADRYQIVSHALSYNAKNAVLIVPNNGSHRGVKLIKKGSVGAGYSIDVYEYHFDLSSENLEEEERALTRDLLSICRSTVECVGRTANA